MTLHGDGVKQSGLAVLDTGASMSAIDIATANTLGCPVTGVATWAAVQAVEGEQTSEMRQVALQVHGDNRRFAFDLIGIQGLQHAVEGYPVVVLLGWDFLGRCRLSCDGPAGTFALELPITPRTNRRTR